MSTKPRSNLLFVAMAAVLLGTGAQPNNAEACLTPDGVDPVLYRNLAASSGGRLVWTTGTNSSGGTVRLSGVLIDPWNVLTAAHAVPAAGSGGTVDFVGTGTNRYSDPGTVVGIVSWIRYPTYVSGFSNPDLAIIHLAQPINIAPAVFAGVSTGEMLTAAGFGRYATPSIGLQPDDGSSMGWRAPVLSSNPGNVSPQYFYSTDFDTGNGVSLNGRGMSGDSGGPVWNSAGALVGITVGGFGGLGTIGGTTAARLDVPEVLAWIEANRLRPPVLGLAPIGSAMRLTWGTNPTGYRLQTSEALPTWTDLGSVLSGPGTHDDPTTNRPHRFYRLAKP